MSKQGLTEILCVIDKSGSMHDIAKDVVGGFNRFLAEQKACPGEAKLTLTLFDTMYQMPCKHQPLADVPELTDETYVPGGCTALLDAIGKTITEAGAEFASRPEDQRPEKVVMLIMTDGQENSSRDHTTAQIRQMIERQQKEWNWQFVFIGANQDAFAEANKIGVDGSNVANFKPTGQSMSRAYTVMAQNLCDYRAGTKATMSFDGRKDL